MKYMLLIHQGDTPTSRSPEAWARLSEEEQQAVYRTTRRSTERGRHAGPGAPGAGDRDDRPRRGRKDADDRRPFVSPSRRRSAAGSSTRPTKQYVTNQ